jgi:hypothetical protein
LSRYISPLSESVEEEEETGCQQQGFSSATEGEELKYGTPSSVADPEPDMYVLRPPGSGFISTRYRSRSGSGSFYHQAIIGRKTLISTVL